MQVLDLINQLHSYPVIIDERELDIIDIDGNDNDCVVLSVER